MTVYIVNTSLPGLNFVCLLWFELVLSKQWQMNCLFVGAVSGMMLFYVNFVIAEVSLVAKTCRAAAYKKLIECLIHVFEMNYEINIKWLLCLIWVNAYVCVCNHICSLLEGIKIHLFNSFQSMCMDSLWCWMSSSVFVRQVIQRKGSEKPGIPRATTSADLCAIGSKLI